MRRKVIQGAESLRDSSTRRGHRTRCVMVTLTYRPGCEWRSDHVSRCLTAAREWARRRGGSLYYAWVAELQEGRQARTGERSAAVLHYHAIFFLPTRLMLPQFDRRGWWPHGMTKVEAARSAVGYLVKYASKGGDHSTFPRGARLFGLGGLEPEGRFAVHRAGLPSWLAAASVGRVRRVAGHGWVDLATGEIHRSPYVFVIGLGDGGAVYELWKADCAVGAMDPAATSV